jgi:hypothetical protein
MARQEQGSISHILQPLAHGVEHQQEIVAEQRLGLALGVIGFAGALRRSELIGLDLGDIAFTRLAELAFKSYEILTQ